MLIIITVLLYFAALMLFSRVTARRGDNNQTFFRANRRSPWYMVAFGMVGASISGITFVSVPGMTMFTGMTYVQMCIGFILGYFAVAFVLLPVYYRLNLTTIYTYLKERLGLRSYKTGAWFFLISKMTGAAVRFYVVCIILQRFVLDAIGVPFALTVVAMVALIWLYTRRGGIKTLVWTDTFQTTCMFAALILIIYNVMGQLGMSATDAVKAIAADEHSRMFVLDDWISTQNFWKQLLSGAFVVIVMTGLDQDMMQKNLTCRTLREAQKDGIALPASGDELLPMFAATGRLGSTVVVLFTIGIVAASFSSADSALTALTTSYCVDIRQREGDEQLRRSAHIGIAVVFGLFILMFKTLNSTSVIDAIYILCSYTYGPLLGLFAFGLFTNRKPCDKLVPYIAVASPLVCFALEKTAMQCWGYKFGYELLMINGLLTFVGLYVSGRDGERRASVV